MTLFVLRLVLVAWIRWYIARQHITFRSTFDTRLVSLQIQTSNGEVVITNDGATILKHMAVLHPAAKMVIGGI